ncbi:MAG: FG-GAP-like repeat-containing protein [Planctomycetaceae bacterium]
MNQAAGVTNLVSEGEQDIFLLKLDSSGDLVWAKSVGGSATDTVYSFDLDSVDNIVLAGTFNGTVDFDPGTGVSNLTSVGRDIYVLKIDNSGDFVWVKGISGTETKFAEGVAVDDDGNVVVVGSFFGTVDFDPGVGVHDLENPGTTSNIFILKLDEAGSFEWVHTVEMDDEIEVYDVQVDDEGSVYTTGTFSGMVDFDPGVGVASLSVTNGSAVFLSKLNAAGEFVWVEEFSGDSSYGAGDSTLLDANGALYVIGAFSGSIDFDSSANQYFLTSTGDQSAFVTKLKRKYYPHNLSITKSSTGTTQLPGDQIVYTITVANEGKFDADDATVFDELTSILTDVSWSATLYDGAIGNTSGTGNIDELVDLPVGASIVYTATGILKNGFYEFVTNTATITPSDWVDDNPDDNSASDTDLVTWNVTGGLANFVENGQSISNPYQDVDGMDVGDLDGDGDLDILIATSGFESIVTVWLNSGNAEFTSAFVYETDFDVRSIAFGDLNNDGYLDAYISTRTSDEIWLNDGSGEFTPVPQVISNGINYGNALGDLDGDGLLDLLATSNSAGVQLYRNLGGGLFDPFLQTPGDAARDVAVGDFDGDGDLDFILVDDDEDDYVWFNDGQGNFTISTQSLGHLYSDTVKVGDLDGDGDLDIVVATFQDELNVDNESLIWLNDGTGQFTAGQLLPTNFVEEIELGDLDGDGDIDLYISEYEGTGSSVWLNDGSAQFTRTSQVLPAVYSAVSRLGDFDGDGDLDVAMGVFEGTSRILLNDAVELPYYQDFESGDTSGLNLYISQNFDLIQENGNTKLEATSWNYPGLNTAIVGTTGTLPEQFDVAVQMKARYEPGYWTDGFLVFDYQSEDNFKYAGMLAGQNQWVIGHYQGHWGNRVAQVDWDDTGRSINPGTTYNVLARINGDEVELVVNGESVVTGTFGANVNNGRAGFAAYNGATQFDNFMLATEVGAMLTYHENFDDGTADDLVPLNPSLWSIYSSPAGNSYQVDSTSTDGLGISLLNTTYDLPSYYEIDADIYSISGPDRWQDGFLIFDYKNENDFKYAGMFTGQNQWVIGHYQGNFGNRLAQVDWDDIGRDIYSDSRNHVLLIINGYTATLQVNHATVVSATFSEPLNLGQAGLAAYNAVTRFDNVNVGYYGEEELFYSHFSHWFYYGADGFFPNNPALWSLEGSGDDVEYVADSTSTGGLATSTFIPLEIASLGEFPEDFEFSALVKSTDQPDHWSDAFLIFDYKNDNDFKYAGMFAVQNQWVIGHYQGHWGNRYSTVDWDDTGRSINNGTTYEMAVQIHDDVVEFYVNGEFITSADTNTPLNNAAFGLANYNARTSFILMEMDEISPPASVPIDNAFAEYDGSLVG